MTVAMLATVGASGFHGESLVCGVFCGGFGLEWAEKSGGVHGIEFEAVGAGFSGERGAGRVPVGHWVYHVLVGAIWREGLRRTGGW